MIYPFCTITSFPAVLGRKQYFLDYRLRIAEVVRDYDMRERAQLQTR